MNLQRVLFGVPDSILDSLSGRNKSSSMAILIPHSPVAKGRPRYTRQGRCYTPKKTLEAEQVVKLFVAAQVGNCQLEGPLALELLSIFPIPASWSKKKKSAAVKGDIKPENKPDFDNVLKLYCDALNGLLWQDDKQIVDGRCIKCYGEHPAVVIWCWPVK